MDMIMTLFAFALLLQSATMPAELSGEGREIEVLGSRLKKLTLDLAMSGASVARCRVSTSSGDDFVDRQACRAAYACVSDGVTGAQQLIVCMNSRILSAVRADNLRRR
jgi:hypothetical protein